MFFTEQRIYRFKFLTQVCRLRIGTLSYTHIDHKLTSRVLL